MMDWDDCIGASYLFYGVDNQMLKLDEHVFEVLENPDDGYRSYFDTVEAKESAKGIFYRDPIAIVIVRTVNSGNDEGYELIEEECDHVWLRFGTNNDDDYYPCFFFNYTPRPGPMNTKKSVRKIHDHDINPFDRLFDARDS